MNIPEIGLVIKIFNSQISPPKHKYMVCVAVTESLFFCINTQNRKIYECVKIEKKHNNFLEYDSFISCNQAFHFDIQQLKSAVPVGHLAYNDLRLLYNHVKTNVKTLPPQKKQKILEALQVALADYE